MFVPGVASLSPRQTHTHLRQWGLLRGWAVKSRDCVAEIIPSLLRLSHRTSGLLLLLVFLVSGTVVRWPPERPTGSLSLWATLPSS